MFRVSYTEGARRDLQKMDSQWARKILLAVRVLAMNPFKKSDVKKLVNSHLYRLRVGKYRVVYDLQRDQLVIVVIHIKKRDGVYR